MHSNKTTATETGRAFYDRFLAVTDPSSYCGRIRGGIVYAFIRRNLRAYNLDSLYTENDILNEVFIRALEAQKKGKAIINLQAWIRGASLNVIRELSRKEKRTFPMGDWQDFAAMEQLDSMELNQEIESVQQAFQTLQPIDQAILMLKVVEGHPWEKVIQILDDKTGQSFAVTALRKRKQRALDLLRKRVSLESVASNIPTPM
jgi:DNA-directed RNA polymerase specialized sigma24 family protein